MRVALWIVFALLMILFGAELFTNAVEWLGRKWHLGQGAVGSVLAALGTALPETAVPITAILFNKGKPGAEEVGIGGILGAPFLLVTLGSLILAISLVMRKRKNRPGLSLEVQHQSFQRDMTFFLLAYSSVMLTGLLPVPLLHQWFPVVLLCLYGVFVFLTVRAPVPDDAEEDLHPLYLQLKAEHPSGFAVGFQLLVALAAIVGGAHFLSNSVEQIAARWQIPTFVLSAILIPLATELPETLNSVVWVRQGKDGLAVGNITGAMVFQSTVVPAIGIWLTPWKLNPEALLTGALTLTAGALIFGFYQLRIKLVPGVLVAASLLYWLLPLHTIAVRVNLQSLYVVGGALVVAAIVLTIRSGRQLMRSS